MEILVLESGMELSGLQVVKHRRLLEFCQKNKTLFECRDVSRDAAVYVGPATSIFLNDD